MAISTIGSNSLNQTSDLTINGVTVGKGGGAVSTNTAVGASALNGNAGGASNTAVGASALTSNTTTNNSTAVGYQAGYNNIAASNTFVGAQAGKANTSGSNNVFVGDFSGYASAGITGNWNTVVGSGGGAGSNLTSGNSNTFIGSYTGYGVTTGVQNTFIGSNASGYGAGYLVTTGSKNTIIGGYSGNQGSLDIRTSSNYVVLSDGDGNPWAYWNNTGSMYFGGSNQVMHMPSTGGLGRVGNITTGNAFQISYNSASGGVQLTGGATSWASFSDQRLKNITGRYTSALADIAQIQPVKFTWKSDTENKPQVGVLAQSVQSVVPEAVESLSIEIGSAEEYLTVRYTELIPLMIASIQELKTIVDAQAAEIAELKAKVA